MKKQFTKFILLPILCLMGMLGSFRGQALGIVSPISGSHTVCVGATDSLSDTTSGGTWISLNTGIATIDATGNVIGVSAGVDTIEFTHVGDTTAVFYITVNPLPHVSAISGMSTVCVNSTINLMDSVLGGMWMATNSHATVNVDGMVMGVSAGVDTIKYMDSTACGSLSALVAITVNPLPSIHVISGGSTLCLGSMLTLMDTTTGGIWSSSVSADSISDSGIVYGNVAGVDTIRYTTMLGSCSATKWKAITIYPTHLSMISGLDNVCVGSMISLTDSFATGTWLATNGNATVTGGVVTGITAGIDTIKYMSISSCGMDTVWKAITINDLPNAGVITGANHLCVGATTLFADTIMGGTWYLLNGNAAFDSSSVVRGITPGVDTIKYEVTNSFGCMSYTWMPFTVNPLPIGGTISGPSSICVNATATYTDSSAMGSTHMWWLTNGHGTDTVIGMTIVVKGISAGVDTIKYMDSNSCGSVTVWNVVTVNPLPTAGIIMGIDSICVGASATFTDSTAMGTSHTWALYNTNGMLDSTMMNIVHGVSAGIDTLWYTSTNGCGDHSTWKIITIDSIPSVAAITGYSSVCLGTLDTLADSTGFGNWSSNNMAVATVSVTGIVHSIMAGFDTIKYTVTNIHGCYTTVLKSITVNPTTLNSIMGADSNVCIGSMITLTDSTATGTWSASNGNATVSGGMITGVTAGIDTIKYMISASCVGSNVTTKVITINSLPTISPITGTNHVCVGANDTLSDAGGTWLTPSNPSVVELGNIITGHSAGTVTISYLFTSIHSCTAIATFPMTVNPLANHGTITGSSLVCAGATNTFSDTTANGATTWSLTNYIGASDSTIGMQYLITGMMVDTIRMDTIKIKVTNMCNTDSTWLPITINPLPTPSAISGLDSVCPGSTITLSTTHSGGMWSVSDSNATVSDSGVVMGMMAGTDIISYTTHNICGHISTTLNVTINSLPNAGMITGWNMVCPMTMDSLSDSVMGGMWFIKDTSIAKINDSTGVVTGMMPGFDTIKYKVTNVCGSDSTWFAITVNPMPHASMLGSFTGTDSLCIGSNLTLIDSVIGGTWTALNSHAFVAGDSVIFGLVGAQINGISDGLDTIQYKITNMCGSDSVWQVVTVSSAPTVTPIFGHFAEVCIGTPDTLACATLGGTWSVKNSSIATISLNGIITPVTAGKDSVFYTVSNHCGSASASNVITVYTEAQCDSIDRVSTVALNSGIRVYPNPASGIVTIEFAGTSTNFQASLIDIYGKIVATNNELNTNNQKITFDTQNLPSGNYVLIVNVDGKMYREKLVVISNR